MKYIKQIQKVQTKYSLINPILVKKLNFNLNGYDNYELLINKNNLSYDDINYIFSIYCIQKRSLQKQEQNIDILIKRLEYLIDLNIDIDQNIAQLCKKFCTLNIFPEKFSQKVEQYCIKNDKFIVQIETFVIYLIKSKYQSKFLKSFQLQYLRNSDKYLSELFKQKFNINYFNDITNFKSFFKILYLSNFNKQQPNYIQYYDFSLKTLSQILQHKSQLSQNFIDIIEQQSQDKLFEIYDHEIKNNLNKEIKLRYYYRKFQNQNQQMYFNFWQLNIDSNLIDLINLNKNLKFCKNLKQKQYLEQQICSYIQDIDPENYKLNLQIHIYIIKLSYNLQINQQHLEKLISNSQQNVYKLIKIAIQKNIYIDQKILVNFLQKQKNLFKFLKTLKLIYQIDPSIIDYIYNINNFEISDIDDRTINLILKLIILNNENNQDILIFILRIISDKHQNFSNTYIEKIFFNLLKLKNPKMSFNDENDLYSQNIFEELKSEVEKRNLSEKFRIQWNQI